MLVRDLTESCQKHAPAKPVNKLTNKNEQNWIEIKNCDVLY